MTHSFVFTDDVQRLFGDHRGVSFVQRVDVVVQVFHHIYEQEEKKKGNKLQQKYSNTVGVNVWQMSLTAENFLGLFMQVGHSYSCS